jgi:hypothetical protein
MNFEVMAMAAVNNPFGSLEVSAEVVDQLWMTEIDVQGRRRTPELPQRGRLSQCHADWRSVNGPAREIPQAVDKCSAGCG